jgi:hypothetical protein
MLIANAAENFNLVFPYLPTALNEDSGKIVSNNGLSIQLKETGMTDYFGNTIYSLLFKETDEDILSIYFALDFERKELIPLEYDNMLSQQQCSAFDFSTGLITSEKTLIKLDAYFNECLRNISNRFKFADDSLIYGNMNYK